MKTLYKVLLVLGVVLSTQFETKAQELKDTTLIVNGVCNMCKMTIETAADIKGVKVVEWNVESKVLALSYDPEKVRLVDINKSVNESGYDTEYSVAEEEAYQALHKCCHYRDPEVVKDHQ